MKAFYAALLTLAALLAAIITLSLLTEARVEGYLAAVPDENAPPEEVATALSALLDEVEKDRLLLGALFSHERIDATVCVIERARAAARMGEEGEYAPMLSELTSLLESLGRDLRPSLADIL